MIVVVVVVVVLVVTVVKAITVDKVVKGSKSRKGSESSTMVLQGAQRILKVGGDATTQARALAGADGAVPEGRKGAGWKPPRLYQTQRP